MRAAFFIIASLGWVSMALHFAGAEAISVPLRIAGVVGSLTVVAQMVKMAAKPKM